MWSYYIDSAKVSVEIARDAVQSSCYAEQI